MYILNYGISSVGAQPGTISVIDCATNTITATINCYAGPQAIAYCPTNNLLYVAIYFANSGANYVQVIDPTTNTIVNQIVVGLAPSGICYVPTLDNLYVTNQTAGTISVISAATSTVVSTIVLTANPTIFTPGAIQYCPANNCLYAVNYAASECYVVNLVSGAQSVAATGANPYDVQFCPSNNYMYVANQSPNTVTILDSANNSVFKTVSVGAGPSGIGWCPTNNTMYVANFTGATLSALQCGTHVTSDKLQMVGPITQSVATGQFFTSNSAATTNQYINIANTGGNFLFGLENSVGDSLATGAVAYSTVLTTIGATWLHFGVNGVVKLSVSPTGTTIAKGGIETAVVAVSALPTAGAGNVGQRIMVSNSNATTTAGIGAIVAAGGANVVPVYSDGVNWRIG
jgi:YVTN family beta-propeller protein